MFIEQPWVGFDYDFTFTCPNDHRVVVPAEQYELQTCGKADLPLCECGAEVDVRELSPTLRNVNDPALLDDSVEHLIWYHTSTYRDWPDREAHRANVRAEVARLVAPNHERRRRLDLGMSLALHVGSYESAIDNMMRRIDEQDPKGTAAPQYFLHRVLLRLGPGDLLPGTGDELADWFGEVPLGELHKRGARAVRYINVNEAHGSISLAIDPVVVASAATIALPVESVAPETRAAAEATVAAAAKLAVLDRARPVAEATEAPSKLQYFRSAVRGRNPERQAVWNDFEAVLSAEYLPTINPQIRDRFEGVLPERDGDPAGYHRQFRLLAGLLAHPQDVIAQLASAPVRTFS